jgi:hypothetical protein
MNFLLNLVSAKMSRLVVRVTIVLVPPIVMPARPNQNNDQGDKRYV